MILLLIVATGLTSVALTGLVRAYALKHEVLDRPNARSSHSAPTPRGGGVALVTSVAVWIIIAVTTGLIDLDSVLVLGAGALLVSAVGWTDDVRGISAGMRLMLHVVIAFFTLLMLHGFPLLRIGARQVNLGMGGYVLGVLGIVWCINLFNFMDGIDGLAGSQAVLIFGAAAALLFYSGERSLGTLSGCVAGAAAGFLVWNWPPARIFLGDAGSGALGYLLAALALASENKHAVPLLAFAMLSGVLITDATVTLSRRVARGKKPTEAHRDHAYQRLARGWKSHRPVTYVAATVTIVLATFAAMGTIAPTLLVPLFCTSAVMLAGLLVAVEIFVPM